MQFSPSPSPSPAIARQKSEPDLFFPSSDSEDDRDEVKPSTEAEHRLPSPSSSKVLNGSAPGSRSRTPLFDDGESNGHVKGHKSMRSQDSDIIPLDQAPSSASVAGPSRSLKRPSPPSRAPSFQVPESFSGGYLGEFVCEGWSLSKGKGYCTPGSKIVFERPKAAKVVSNDVRPAGKVERFGPGKLVGGKMVNNPKGKQMTLGAMMAKKATPPPTRKPGAKPTVDSIIRFRN
jgi:DNA repair protein RAD5